MTMSLEQGKRVDVQPARPMVDRKMRIKRSLYRFLGALGVMTLLVACGDISVEPSVNQPVIVNTEAAPTQEAETGAGDPPDPEDNEEVEITVQVPAPTDEPVATATPEADPTRAAVSEINGFSALSPADQEVLISWAGNANLGVLGSPESFSILNACHLVVTADFPEGSSYNRGDHIVKTPDGGFFIFTSWALDDEGNTVEVDDLGYDLVLTDLAGNPVVEYSPGQTRASWVGPNGELFIFEPISGTFITIDELNYRIDLMSAQSYFFDVVEVEYEDGVAYGLDANGNRIAMEDETGQWKEYVAPSEGDSFMFAQDGEFDRYIEGMQMPDADHTIVFTLRGGWQPGTAFSHPNIVSPQDFFQRIDNEGVIYAPGPVVNFDSQSKVGANRSVDTITAWGVIEGTTVHYDQTGDNYQCLNLYTYVKGSNGEDYLIVVETPIRYEKGGTYTATDRNDFFSQVGPDGEPIFTSFSNGTYQIPGVTDIQGMANFFIDNGLLFYSLDSSTNTGVTRFVRGLASEPNGQFDPDQIFEEWAWAGTLGYGYDGDMGAPNN